MIKKPIYEQIYQHIKENYCDISLLNRKEPYKTYRKCYFLLCYKYCPHVNYGQIAECIDRDHSTMCYSIDSLLDLMSVYEDVRFKFRKMEKEILEKIKSIAIVDSEYKNINDYELLKLQRDAVKMRLKYKKIFSKNHSLAAKTKILTDQNSQLKLDAEVIIDQLMKERKRSENLRYRLKKMKNIEVKLEKVG